MTPAPGLRPPCWTVFLSPYSRPRPTAWAWGWRFVSQSSRATAAVFGRCPISPTAPLFNSQFRLRKMVLEIPHTELGYYIGARARFALRYFVRLLRTHPVYAAGYVIVAV